MAERKKETKLLFAKHIFLKIFFEDWALKLTALVITLALWLGVTGLSTPTTKRLSVPLNLSVSSNQQVTNMPQQEVEIEISGDKRKIDEMNRSLLAATLDLSDVPPGDRVVSLSPETVFVPLPQGIKLIDVAPSRIVVNLEAVEEKEIAVKAATTGEPAAGYEVYSITSIPARIRVRGPASVVEKLEFVRTEVIDIADRKADFTARQITVGTGDARAAVLDTVVDVVFRIGEKRLERHFDAAVVGETEKTATVVLFGPRTVLSKLRSDDLKVEMYLNERGEETPRLILPPDIQNILEVRRLSLN